MGMSYLSTLNGEVSNLSVHTAGLNSSARTVSNFVCIIIVGGEMYHFRFQASSML